MAFLDTIHKAHVIGAGGIGISAVAKLLKANGKRVTGSDMNKNEAVGELETKGIPVAMGHRAENVPADTDIIIFSSAVPYDNPERVFAREHKIREMEYFAFLGEYSKEKRTICVSGTNGKSTTTALLGLMLEAAGFDPIIIVGSKVPTFADQNLRIGNSEWFVVEACEHMAHMLMFQPWGIVLTNIEEDHLDFYRDIAHIHETFQEYVGKLPHGGLLVRNADDARCMSLTTSAKAISFSAYANHADYRAENHSVKNAQQFFAITTGSHTYNDMTLRIPGTFNIANALGAAAMALEVGVKPETIRDVLAQFRGIWRRFETLGEFNGAPLISDYGHHPTAVAETVKAAKSFYPEKKIVLAFQPHHQNRTKKLFTEFVESFDGADTVLLQEIYDVAGREDASQKISSSQLVEAIRERDIKNHKNRTLAFMENRDQIESWLRANASASDVVLLMGAGEIYKVGHSLIKNN